MQSIMPPSTDALQSHHDYSKLPQHVGDTILPNFSIFNRLLFFAGNRDNLVVNDVTNGLKATHRQLLSDVLHLRNALQARLDPDTRRRLLQGDEIAINLLASGGYEFATAFLALLALGAVIVPICECFKTLFQRYSL